MKENYIVVTFVFTNNGNDPANVSDIGLYLYNSQDREFETGTDVRREVRTTRGKGRGVDRELRGAARVPRLS